MTASLEGWWQLQQLMTRYAAACDACDWEAYRALFTADAWIDYTQAFGRAGPVDEIVPWLGQIMDRSGVASTQHLLANLQADVTGDEAWGRAYYFNPDVVVEGGARRALINGGIYTFEARRAAPGWQLRRLTATLLWSTRAELCTYEPPA